MGFSTASLCGREYFMRDTLIKNLESRFAAYNDIVTGCNDDALQAKLDIPKHKSLAEHLWCVVGARESYAAAIESGEWKGFSCSLQQFTQADFSEKLKESATVVLSAIDSVDEWTEQRNEFLLTLNEHEVMHEGQLIKHMYGLGYDIPGSVKWS
jgi:uncharacterized damage-inducible protein DinB